LWNEQLLPRVEEIKAPSEQTTARHRVGPRTAKMKLVIRSTEGAVTTANADIP